MRSVRYGYYVSNDAACSLRNEQRLLLLRRLGPRPEEPPGEVLGRETFAATLVPRRRQLHALSYVIVGVSSGAGQLDSARPVSGSFFPSQSLSC